MKWYCYSRQTCSVSSSPLLSHCRRRCRGRCPPLLLAPTRSYYAWKLRKLEVDTQKLRPRSYHAKQSTIPSSLFPSRRWALSVHRQIRHLYSIFFNSSCLCVLLSGAHPLSPPEPPLATGAAWTLSSSSSGRRRAFVSASPRAALCGTPQLIPYHVLSSWCSPDALALIGFHSGGPEAPEPHPHRRFASSLPPVMIAIHPRLISLSTEWAVVIAVSSGPCCLPLFYL